MSDANKFKNIYLKFYCSILLKKINLMELKQYHMNNLIWGSWILRMQILYYSSFWKKTAIELIGNQDLTDEILDLLLNHNEI